MAETDAAVKAHEVDLSRFVTEIECNTGSLSAILRSVANSGQLEPFAVKLRTRVGELEREIESVCSARYGEFADALREVSTLRNEASQLDTAMQDANAQLRDAAKNIRDAELQCTRSLQTMANCDLAIERIRLCTPVLDAYSKLETEIAAKRFYVALKTADQLEFNLLPRVDSLRFAKLIKNQVGEKRRTIEKALHSDLHVFLETLRTGASRLGERALQQCARQNNMPFKQHFERPQELNKSEVVIDADGSPFDDAQVDFSPVLHALHIKTVVGQRESFYIYYRKQREEQVRAVCADWRSHRPALYNLNRLVYDAVGFFVVEKALSHICSAMITRTYLTEMWEIALQRIVFLVKAHLLQRNTDAAPVRNSPNESSFDSAQELLEAKQLLVLFSVTMKEYGFNVAAVHNVLVETIEVHTEVLMRIARFEFDRSFADDNYTPVTLRSHEDLARICEIYTFTKDAEFAAAMKQPQTDDFQARRLIFSLAVPRIARSVRNFVHSCVNFAADLHLSQTELSDSVCNAVNGLLSRVLYESVRVVLARPHTNLVQLVQLFVNVTYLERMSSEVDDYIALQTGSLRDGASTQFTGVRTTAFKDVIADCEDKLESLLRLRVQETFDLSSYDLATLNDPTAPSSYMLDLVAFLDSTFLSFRNTLPDSLLQTACLTCCKQVAYNLKEALVSPQYRMISIAGLRQISLDLEQCENFAKSNPVRGLEGALSLAFAELRQLLELFIRNDWAKFFAEYGKPDAFYLRVNPHTVIVILEKVIAFSDKKPSNMMNKLSRVASIAGSNEKQEKERRKLHEKILHELRLLANNISGANAQTPHEAVSSIPSLRK